MVNRELEFRGINRKYLEMYFEELGGKQITDFFPITFEHNNWRAEILKEEEISLTSTIKVNQIHIRFHAKDDDTLQELIKNYRYKTTRIGG